MKKLIRSLAVLIVAAWVLQDPHGAAHLAHQVLAWLSAAVHSVSALTSGL